MDWGDAGGGGDADMMAMAQRGKDGFAMADYRGIPGCLVLGFEAR